MEKDIYHIASDYFSGRISETDRKYLNNWLEQLPENKQVFAELERVWKLTGSLQANVEPDVDQEWSRFLINKDKGVMIPLPIESKVRSIFSPLIRIAAIAIPAVLVVGCLLFLFIIKSTSNQEWVAIQSGETAIEQVLPDGSKVWMNRNSSLSYPKEFTGAQRKVKLTGEGFFSVVKGKGTFTIEAGTSEIKVLGTQFNVRNYLTEAATEVMVKEGKVSFASMADKQSNVVLVTGEKGLLNNSTNEIQKSTSSNDNALGWFSHTLTFNNETLSEVANDISRYFNKKAVVRSGANITFTGTFTNPQLTEVLRTLNLSLNYSCQLKNDTVFIEK